MSLEVLLAGLIASVGIIFSFSLGASSAGMITEAKACSKPWEAAPSCGTSTALFEDISLGTSGSFFAPADWEKEDPGAVFLQLG